MSRELGGAKEIEKSLGGMKEMKRLTTKNQGTKGDGDEDQDRNGDREILRGRKPSGRGEEFKVG